MEEYTRKGGNFLCEDHSSLSAPIEHHEDTSKLSNMMMSRGQYSNSSCSLRLDEKTVNSEGSGRSLALTFLVGILGVLSATMFVCFGVTAEAIKQDQAFHHVAEEFALQVEAALVDYETASRWLHQACAFQNITRSEFHDLYEYMTLSLEVQNINWLPRIRHDERAALEESSRSYFAENVPDFVYGGLQELFWEEKESEWSYRLVPRQEAEIYYPAHLVEPMMNNSLLLDFDVASGIYSLVLIEETLKTWSPVISRPFRLFPGTTMLSEHNTLMLLHPGIPLENHPEIVPKDLAMIIVNMDMIVKKMLSGLNYDSVAVYLYDTRGEPIEHVFLIGVNLSMSPASNKFYLPEITLKDLKASTKNLIHTQELSVVSTVWTIAVIALDGEFTNNNSSTIIAGVFIFVACTFVAFWILWDTQRNRKIQVIKQKADAEKAAIKVQSAQENARAEQELNDYIAHEIRNPLAAAMSACCFVKTAVHDIQPLRDKHMQLSVREDVDIIDSSLTFINDLLRSMLDMHKAASKRIDVTFSLADVKRDILQPVAAMLYTRDSNFKVLVECPDNLIVSTDKIRLKQVVLNLGRNSTKFVEKGFIKLAANTVHGRVCLFIEDSGPGISEEKRRNIFNKFQESLDVLEQGTGMGLFLCKNLIQLLGGDIRLDESYDSGVPACAGTRFIVDTNLIPMSVDECQERLLHDEMDEIKGCMEKSIQKSSGNETPDPSVELGEAIELPVTLSVLFVDDDMLLRKLFSRSVKRVASTWSIKEAANGESALQMTLEDQFDLIFMDQYMASAEKTMLGTETTRAMRAQGVKSLICGLSANDMKQNFLNAGANFFLQKPFPCKPDDLRKELFRILNTKQKASNVQKTMDDSSLCSNTIPLGDSDSSALPEVDSGDT